MKLSIILAACLFAMNAAAETKAPLQKLGVKQVEQVQVKEEMLQELDTLDEDLYLDEEDAKFFNLTNDADPVPMDEEERVALKKELEAAKAKPTKKK